MFSLICVWINGWVNNREAGDLRRYHAHRDVTVMVSLESALITLSKANFAVRYTAEVFHVKFAIRLFDNVMCWIFVTIHSCSLFLTPTRLVQIGVELYKISFRLGFTIQLIRCLQWGMNSKSNRIGVWKRLSRIALILKYHELIFINRFGVDILMHYIL